MPKTIEELVHERLGEASDSYLIPPPVFRTMGGEFLAHDAENGVLETRFPVLDEYLNPYGTMQGGMIAAAVDNTLGPLSMLVAPPNVTRRLEMKYGRPVTPEMGTFTVKARLLRQSDQWLTFSAEVRAPNGDLLARAKAVHWIIEPVQIRKEVAAT